MSLRALMPVLILAAITSTAIAQTKPAKSPSRAPGWKPPGSSASKALAEGPTRRGSPSAASLVPLKPVQRGLARVSKGNGTLPNDHGQIWREYDITPYTTRVTSTNRPEQALVDWILRETGYESWHSEPLGILSANRRILRCYHTPEIQAIVAQIVDRFVTSEAESHAFGLRIVTVTNPNWRARSLRLMKPVPVQTQGVQAWLLAKEDAALLISDLRKRTDYREHSSPHLLVNNGQSTVISTIRPRNYIRGVTLQANGWPGYQPEIGQIDEGFSLEFSPLLSLDSRTVDAIIKLRLSQVEKMVPVMLEVPTVASPRQRTKIEVPQVTMANMHERFRWPTNQVLLLSMGVVATPAPAKGNLLTSVLPIPKSPSRADALLFVECRGPLAPVANNGRPGARTAGNYPQRY